MALVAVIDIGKSNAKLSLIDPNCGLKVYSASRPCQAVHCDGLRQLDLAGTEHWLFSALRSAPDREQVSAIVPIAHGAAVVLLDAHEEVLAAPDYEDEAFQSVDSDYQAQRDPFECTYSPKLPRGLNLGRQLYFLEHCRPELFARTRHVLLYPQYWAWRLSGVMASEVTSLGCHSDLWLPAQRDFSPLTKRRQWAGLFPPLRSAQDTLGTIRPEVTRMTGLNARCRVSCGIHDSNASYLDHLLLRGRTKAFCAISSGTWTITMASTMDLHVLREDRDMLANVDAFASPVPTARYMGGREYAAIAQTTIPPNHDDLRTVVQRRALALPAFTRSGPFAGVQGTLAGATELTDAQRAALATLYSALVSDYVIELLGARGDIFLDGPLGANTLFASTLAAWHPQVQVFTARDSRRMVSAATFLAGFALPPPAPPLPADPLSVEGLAEYRCTWREQLPKAS